VHQYAFVAEAAIAGNDSLVGRLPDLVGNIAAIDLSGGSCLNGAWDCTLYWCLISTYFVNWAFRLWTCGNIAATGTPIDIARFHWELHNLNIVNRSSLAQMMTFKPMTSGWSPQVSGPQYSLSNFRLKILISFLISQLYGLGLMHTFPLNSLNEIWSPDSTNQSNIIGHGGVDYGSFGIVNGFNVKYGFGFSFAANTETGNLNCSVSTRVGSKCSS
jgi:hypothetical protein